MAAMRAWVLAWLRRQNPTHRLQRGLRREALATARGTGSRRWAAQRPTRTPLKPQPHLTRRLRTTMASEAMALTARTARDDGWQGPAVPDDAPWVAHRETPDGTRTLILPDEDAGTVPGAAGTTILRLTLTYR